MDWNKNKSSRNLPEVISQVSISFVHITAALFGRCNFTPHEYLLFGSQGFGYCLHAVAGFCLYFSTTSRLHLLLCGLRRSSSLTFLFPTLCELLLMSMQTALFEFGKIGSSFILARISNLGEDDAFGQRALSLWLGLIALLLHI